MSLVEYFSCIFFDTNRFFFFSFLSDTTDRLSSFLSCCLWLPVGHVGFYPPPADPAQPTASQQEVPTPCQLWFERLTPVSLVSAAGPRSSLRPWIFHLWINALFLPPQMRPWISISFHRYSSLLLSLCVYVCIWTCMVFFLVSLISLQEIVHFFLQWGCMRYFCIFKPQSSQHSTSLWKKTDEPVEEYSHTWLTNKTILSLEAPPQNNIRSFNTI